MPAETRKTANYACTRQSQGKPWWRPAAILTCESLASRLGGSRGFNTVRKLTAAAGDGRLGSVGSPGQLETSL
jgi:hypothetical protein